MALITYTTYDDVRATLGVAEEELDDTTLALAAFDALVFEKTLEKFSTFDTRFAELTGIGSKTSMQTRMYNAMKVFYTYMAATQLLSSSDMFAYSKLTDSRTTIERIQQPNIKDAVRDTLSYIQGRLAYFYGQLYPADTITAAASGTRTQLSLVGSTGLATDPVTGA